jgi:ribosomal protein L24
MKVKELNGIAVGDTVTVLKWAHTGSQVKVIEILKDEGARNGWFTCERSLGHNILLAGEEIMKTQTPSKGQEE